MKEYNNIIETLTALFTFNKGKMQVLLIRKKNEPYKGYWVMPGNIVSIRETVEQNIREMIYELTDLKDIYIEQGHLYSNPNRDTENRILAISFIGLVDSPTVNFKMHKNKEIEMKWFDINEIPKLGYDHSKIIDDCIKKMRLIIGNTDIIKNLFPSDFTLPELQRAYEQILNIKIDRRNFRKKIIGMNMLDDTGYKNEKTNGRPAKMYQFKEQLEEQKIF